MYHKASTSMQNRETKIEDAANMIEKDLILLGATAVEDKLQEQVCFNYQWTEIIKLAFNA